MAQISDGSGYSGGGTTTTVCTPSPNDEGAILGNIIKRVSDIEKFLSMLVGADVYANNLSELAKDIGNILNGTIVLPATGSPLGPGGSIPVPSDFSGTVVSGNVTTIWNNGVVSYKVDYQNGVTIGSGGSVNSAWFENGGVHQLITAGTPKYLNFAEADLTSYDPSGIIASIDTIGSGGSAGNCLTLAEDGVYLITYNWEMESISSANGQVATNLGIGGEAWGGGNLQMPYDDGSDGSIMTYDADTIYQRIIHAYAGDQFFISITNDLSNNSYHTWWGFGIVKLANV